MIERFNVPLYQCEVFAVVLGVAVHAWQARARDEFVKSVQSFSCCDTAGNFGVTSQTLEAGLSGREFMAGGATGHAADRLMRAGQRSGRDLSRSWNRNPQHTQHNPSDEILFPESAKPLDKTWV